jgi:hypothetical protein
MKYLDGLLLARNINDSYFVLAGCKNLLDALMVSAGTAKIEILGRLVADAQYQ